MRGSLLSWFSDNLAFMYVHLHSEPMERYGSAYGLPYCGYPVFPCPSLWFVGSCLPTSWITMTSFFLLWRNVLRYEDWKWWPPSLWLSKPVHLFKCQNLPAQKLELGSRWSHGVAPSYVCILSTPNISFHKSLRLKGGVFHTPIISFRVIRPIQSASTAPTSALIPPLHEWNGSSKWILCALKPSLIYLRYHCQIIDCHLNTLCRYNPDILGFAVWVPLTSSTLITHHFPSTLGSLQAHWLTQLLEYTSRLCLFCFFFLLHFPT